MDTAKATKPPSGHANAFEVWKFDAPVVADHDVLDVAFAIDQGADLSSGFVRKLGYLPSKFRRHNLVRRYASGIELFYPPQLIRF
jgi:hypothetical protein